MDLGRIFKAYDIRGLVPQEFDGEVAERIGGAFAVFTGARRIAVGYDARISSPLLAGRIHRGGRPGGMRCRCAWHDRHRHGVPRRRNVR